MHEEATKTKVNPFRVIPKDSTGKWKLILNISTPEGARVNDGINPYLCLFAHLNGGRRCSKGSITPRLGALLEKVDVKITYRTIPGSPHTRPMVVRNEMEGALNLNTMLQFGQCSAPRIFSVVADVVKWIMRRKRI